jgi:uncharacterized protein YndB with AHSA1/START domain
MGEFMADSILVTRTVDAKPEAIFALLATPARHPEFDGAGMLRGTEGSAEKVSAVGDQFIMNMNNANLGDYQMRNTITAYDEGRTIGWAPELYPLDGYKDKIGDMLARGHTYTWELEPSGGGTSVTQIYDWNQVTDDGFRGVFPMVTEEQIADSIERAGRAAR